VKRQAPLWLLGVLVWPGAFLIVTGIIFYVNSRKPDPSGSSHWPFICVLASAITAAVVLVVRDIRARPSALQRAALEVLLNAEPGTIGAVVVMNNGRPEVIATVRSREEYLERAGKGQFPTDHYLYLSADA
jgi:hypothetical protein